MAPLDSLPWIVSSCWPYWNELLGHSCCWKCPLVLYCSALTFQKIKTFTNSPTGSSMDTLSSQTPGAASSLRSLLLQLPPVSKTLSLLWLFSHSDWEPEFRGFNLPPFPWWKKKYSALNYPIIISPWLVMFCRSSTLLWVYLSIKWHNRRNQL